MVRVSWHFKHANSGYIMPKTSLKLIRKAKGVHKRNCLPNMNYCIYSHISRPPPLKIESVCEPKSLTLV